MHRFLQICVFLHSLEVYGLIIMKIFPKIKRNVAMSERMSKYSKILLYFSCCQTSAAYR